MERKRSPETLGSGFFFFFFSCLETEKVVLYSAYESREIPARSWRAVPTSEVMTLTLSFSSFYNVGLMLDLALSGHACSEQKKKYRKL